MIKNLKNNERKRFPPLLHNTSVYNAKKNYIFSDLSLNLPLSLTVINTTKIVELKTIHASRKTTG